jgi:hypothetical protein
VSEPVVNIDEFVFVPKQALVMLLPDETSARQTWVGLADMNVAREDVRILAGATGAKLLDARGEGHGPLARFFRVMQHVGSGENALHVYQDGLKNGGAVMIVPCKRDAAVAVVRMAEQNGGRAAAYFGRGTLEVLSQP